MGNACHGHGYPKGTVCPVTGLTADPAGPLHATLGLTEFDWQFKFDPHYPRGLTFNPTYDCQIKTLYSILGPEIIHRISSSFYHRVHHSEDTEFSDAFSMEANKATIYLDWYLTEFFGGPSLYSHKRGSLFPFLYSTHRLWAYKLTPKFWEKWIVYFKQAAESVQQEEEDAFQKRQSHQKDNDSGSGSEEKDGGDSYGDELKFKKQYIPVLEYFIQRHFEWISATEKEIQQLKKVGEFDDPPLKEKKTGNLVQSEKGKEKVAEHGNGNGNGKEHSKEKAKEKEKSKSKSKDNVDHIAVHEKSKPRRHSLSKEGEIVDKNVYNPDGLDL